MDKAEEEFFCVVWDKEEDILYRDQTGKFLYLSSKGNPYIMVGIHIDSNFILTEAMKNRTEGEMIRAYQKTVDKLRKSGIRPTKYMLANEASTTFKHVIEENGMNYELVPPGNH